MIFSECKIFARVLAGTPKVLRQIVMPYKEFSFSAVSIAQKADFRYSGFPSLNRIFLVKIKSFEIDFPRRYTKKSNTEDTHLTVQEKFIKKVMAFKIGETDISDQTLRKLSERLDYLVQCGCQPYELIECPAILNCDKEEIDKRIKRLQLYKGTSNLISIRLLKYADSSQSDTLFWQNVRYYLKSLTNEQLSKIEILRDALQCSEVEMMEILTRHPNIAGCRMKKVNIPKIKHLMDNGVELEDIRCHPRVLSLSLEKIKQRTADLLEYKYPLSARMFIRSTDETFLRSLERIRKDSKFLPRERFVETKEIITKMCHQGRRISLQQPKILLLLSLSYTAEEIISTPQVLDLSLKSIRQGFDSFGGQNVKLNLESFCQKVRNSQRKGSQTNMLEVNFNNTTQYYQIG